MGTVLKCRSELGDSQDIVRSTAPQEIKRKPAFEKRLGPHQKVVKLPSTATTEHVQQLRHLFPHRRFKLKGRISVTGGSPATKWKSEHLVRAPQAGQGLR